MKVYLSTFLDFEAKFSLGNSQQSMQSPVPILQDCIDAITEHQRLCALVKGEWAKGLLPHSSVWADYTVQRIRGKLCSVISFVEYLYSYS